MLATPLLLVFTPFDNTGFWLTLVALLGLLIMHGVYWTVTHPVNKVRLKDQELQGAGAGLQLRMVELVPSVIWLIL